MYPRGTPQDSSRRTAYAESPVTGGPGRYPSSTVPHSMTGIQPTMNLLNFAEKVIAEEYANDRPKSQSPIDLDGGMMPGSNTARPGWPQDPNHRSSDHQMIREHLRHSIQAGATAAASQNPAGRGEQNHPSAMTALEQSYKYRSSSMVENSLYSRYQHPQKQQQQQQQQHAVAKQMQANHTSPPQQNAMHAQHQQQQQYSYQQMMHQPQSMKNYYPSRHDAYLSADQRRPSGAPNSHPPITNSHPTASNSSGSSYSYPSGVNSYPRYNMQMHKPHSGLSSANQPNHGLDVDPRTLVSMNKPSLVPPSAMGRSLDSLRSLPPEHIAPGTVGAIHSRQQYSTTSPYQTKHTMQQISPNEHQLPNPVPERYRYAYKDGFLEKESAVAQQQPMPKLLPLSPQLPHQKPVLNKPVVAPAAHAKVPPSSKAVLERASDPILFSSLQQPTPPPVKIQEEAPLDLSKSNKRKLNEDGEAPLDLTVKKSKQDDDVIFVGVEDKDNSKPLNYSKSPVYRDMYSSEANNYVTSYKTMMLYPTLSPPPNSVSSAAYKPRPPSSASSSYSQDSSGGLLRTPECKKQSSPPHSYTASGRTMLAQHYNNSIDKLYGQSCEDKMSERRNLESDHRSIAKDQNRSMNMGVSSRVNAPFSGSRTEIIAQHVSMSTSSPTILRQDPKGTFSRSLYYQSPASSLSKSSSTSSIKHPVPPNAHSHSKSDKKDSSLKINYKDLDPKLIAALYRSSSPRTAEILQRELGPLLQNKGYPTSNSGKQVYQNTDSRLPPNTEKQNTSKGPEEEQKVFKILTVHSGEEAKQLVEALERNDNEQTEHSDEKDTIVRPIIEGGTLRGFKHVPIANVKPIEHGVESAYDIASEGAKAASSKLETEVENQVQTSLTLTNTTTCTSTCTSSAVTSALLSSSTTAVTLKTEPPLEIDGYNTAASSTCSIGPTKMEKEVDDSITVDNKSNLSIKSEPAVLEQKEASQMGSLALHLSTPKGRFKLNNSSPAVTEVESVASSPVPSAEDKISPKKKLKKKRKAKENVNSEDIVTETYDKKTMKAKMREKKKKSTDSRKFPLIKGKEKKKFKSQKQHRWSLRRKGSQSGYNRDAAYEAELRRDQQRRLILSAKRKHSKQLSSSKEVQSQTSDLTTEDEEPFEEFKPSSAFTSKKLNDSQKKKKCRPKKSRQKNTLRKKQSLSKSSVLGEAVDEKNALNNATSESDTDEYYIETEVPTHSSGHKPMPPEVKAMSISREVGETKLHKAARLGKEEIAMWILNADVIDINLRDHAGYTPLHEAAANGHIRIAHALLEHNADINATSPEGVRPIHDAVVNNHIEIVRLLLSFGADPKIATYAGFSPLKLAKTEEMKKLLTGYISDQNGPLSAESTWDLPPPFPLAGINWPVFLDVTADPPADPESQEAFAVIQFEEEPLPVYYLLVDEMKGPRNFYMLVDILNKLKIAEEEFTRKYPHITISSISKQQLKDASTSSLTPYESTTDLDVVQIVKATKDIEHVIYRNLDTVNVELHVQQKVEFDDNVVKAEPNCDNVAGAVTSSKHDIDDEASDIGTANKEQSVTESVNFIESMKDNVVKEEASVTSTAEGEETRMDVLIQEVPNIESEESTMINIMKEEPSKETSNNDNLSSDSTSAVEGSNTDITIKEEDLNIDLESELDGSLQIRMSIDSVEDLEDFNIRTSVESDNEDGLPRRCNSLDSIPELVREVDFEQSQTQLDSKDSNIANPSSNGQDSFAGNEKTDKSTSEPLTITVPTEDRPLSPPTISPAPKPLAKPSLPRPGFHNLPVACLTPLMPNRIGLQKRVFPPSSHSPTIRQPLSSKEQDKKNEGVMNSEHCRISLSDIKIERTASPVIKKPSVEDAVETNGDSVIANKVLSNLVKTEPKIQKSSSNDKNTSSDNEPKLAFKKSIEPNGSEPSTHSSNKSSSHRSRRDQDTSSKHVKMSLGDRRLNPVVNLGPQVSRENIKSQFKVSDHKNEHRSDRKSDHRRDHKREHRSESRNDHRSHHRKDHRKDRHHRSASPSSSSGRNKSPILGKVAESVGVTITHPSSSKHSKDLNSNSMLSTSSGNQSKAAYSAGLSTQKGPSQKLTGYSSEYLQFVQQRQKSGESDSVKANIKLSLQNKVRSNMGQTDKK